MTPSVQQLKLPLHIALFVSPIFLLLPIEIYKNDYERASMLEVFFFPMYMVELCN